MTREDDEADALLAAVGFSPDDWSAAASATARSQRRWLRQQAAETATVAGTLLDLAEREEAVTIHAGAWHHRGRLRSVTASLCVVEVAGGDIVLLSTEAVSFVEGQREVADDRLPGPGPTLVSVLAVLVGERPAVRLLLAGGAEVAGSLVGVGKDAASIRRTSSVASVRLSAIDGVVLPARESENRSRQF